MTSAWNEPPGRDDRADGRGPEPDEGQLDMFEILTRASGGTFERTPPDRRRDAGARAAEIVAPRSAMRDFLDVGGSESDELRRLEDSIRWLMNAGNMRYAPPATTSPPLAARSRFETPRIETPRLEGHHDDSLILDPETLFPPRASQRRNEVLRGAAKILLVSAIAAPTAYFAASWMQFPGTAAQSDPAVVSVAEVSVAAPAGVQVAALEFAPAGPAPESVRATESFRGIEDVAKAPPPPQVATPVTTATEPVVAPPPPSPSVAAPLPPEPVQVARGEPEPASAPIPAAAPAKPSMRPEEIALMIGRGRALFDAGDVAAARLLFRRAASAGDAAAAIALGATYDPEVLGQRFIRGIEGDAREAQKWYDKARALGGNRIEMLAHR